MLPSRTIRYIQNEISVSNIEYFLSIYYKVYSSLTAVCSKTTVIGQIYLSQLKRDLRADKLRSCLFIFENFEVSY